MAERPQELTGWCDKHPTAFRKKFNAVQEVGDRHRDDSSPKCACSNGDLERHSRNHRGRARGQSDIERPLRESILGRGRACEQNVLGALVQDDLTRHGIILVPDPAVGIDLGYFYADV